MSILQKPEYPKVLECYSLSMHGETFFKREVVKSKTAEQSFLSKYLNRDYRVDEGKFKWQDISEYGFFTVVWSILPQWIYLLFSIVAFIAGIILQRFLLPCSQ